MVQIITPIIPIKQQGALDILNIQQSNALKVVIRLLLILN